MACRTKAGPKQDPETPNPESGEAANSTGTTFAYPWPAEASPENNPELVREAANSTVTTVEWHTTPSDPWPAEPKRG